jgi:hypothetical protein
MRETDSLSTNLSVGIAVQVRAEMYNISSKVIILSLLNKAL